MVEKIMGIDEMIKSLEQDYTTYKNICCFKLKAIKTKNYNEIKKCSVCNGYSSVRECYDFVDIPHLINFYKEMYKGGKHGKFRKN